MQEEQYGVSSDTTIDNCINYATITGNPDKAKTNVGTGGIIGKGTAFIKNSGNIGNVKLSTSESYSYIGGIIGMSNNETETTIENSYNVGTIQGKCYSVGGIIGYTAASVKITLNNIYNLGIIEVENLSSGGEIIGGLHASSVIELEKIYYKTSNIALVGRKNGTINGKGEQLEETFLKSQEFVSILNQNIEENTQWKKWKLGEKGYPTFE